MNDNPYQESQYRSTAIRIIKSKSGIFGMPRVECNADFECSISDDPHFFYETDNEFVIYVNHFILKDACLVSARFPVSDEYDVKHILFEGHYLLFTKDDEYYHFTFEISGLTGATRTLYAHTLIRENGLTLRVEENDIGRVAGKYSKETYPATEIAAANHYMFAMREIARMLGIPQYLNENKLGYLLILGFETCNEIHTDFPPHWHLIFRWPYFCGSQAPHIYIDSDGKMTHNILYIDGIQGVSKSYEPNEWCKFVDMYGKPVLAFRVDDDGGMSVTKPNGDLFKMSAYTDENGVTVSRNNAPCGSMKVKNDSAAGNIEINWQPAAPLEAAYTEKITFDPLTGVITSMEK